MLSKGVSRYSRQLQCCSLEELLWAVGNSLPPPNSCVRLLKSTPDHDFNMRCGVRGMMFDTRVATLGRWDAPLKSDGQL